MAEPESLGNRPPTAAAAHTRDLLEDQGASVGRVVAHGQAIAS